MSKYLLGIDGGGTKTHACLTDLQGHIVATATNGGANWERIGVPAAQTALLQVINEVLGKVQGEHSDLAGATFALAGMDWSSDPEIFSAFSSSIGISKVSTYINDAVAALYAGIPNGVGIASIAGTGGKTVGFDGTTLVRTMGMSLGEGGGAGQLVGLAVERMATSEHGQTPPTRLSKAIPESYGITDIRTFFKAIAREDLTLTEDRAPIIFELALFGDLGAIGVVQAVAKQHARDVFGIANQLSFADSAILVVRAGGLHCAESAVFNHSFESTLHTLLPQAQSKVLSIAPVIGATIHAASKIYKEIPDEYLQNIHFDSTRLKEF
ncbi:unannotated protein [freshwater metagenome]|uniref:Unannotated protein n=1 Tax=freshwater metagenome TaxID=449393 RepID=A0A6J6W5T4_9ZZZZ|nr:hypothetical protein [Actinomycetota bacterium]MSX48389.1 hypothetical protein [Actinomycetota bacterium]MSX62723.1 hypothetical protein [Actinomycetota bacterium]MSY10142.1 hypothetical protein [Actinomycetota bacterium]MSY55350.1 hypothetical protein [Actinomycetota bacterium]